MNNVIYFKDIVEENGKTVEENNLNRKHKYPVGTRVYFEHESITTCGPKFEKGIFEIYSQDRDCDGTPMYAIISESNNVVKDWEKYCPGVDIKGIINRFGGFGYICGIPENCLMEVPNIEEYSEYVMKQLEEEYKNFKANCD